jgi:hypothetical protein
MPRLRPRLIALVLAFPLFLVAYLTWFTSDEPLDSDMVTTSLDGHTPVWRMAEHVLGASLLIVLAVLVLTATTVAVLRSRGGSRLRRAGYGFAAVVAGGGPVVFLYGVLTHPHGAPPHPERYLVALVAGLLVGIGVLIAAAFAARPERRVAVLAAVPAVLLSLVLLAVSVSIAGYAVDLFAHGVPVIVDGVEVDPYRVTAMPAQYHTWPTVTVIALVASLAALASAGYAAIGTLTAASQGPRSASM